MDLETGKERILALLTKKRVLTDKEMIDCLEGDSELFYRLRPFLIEKGYAKDLGGDSLEYLECTDKMEEKLKPPHFAFISYGRKEEEVALVTRLKMDLLNSETTSCPGKLVINAFLDLDNINSAAVFDKTIEENIEDSTVFLAVISPHAIRKESICRDETVYAYNYRKPIVPLMFKFEKDSKLPLLLCRRNWIDFSSDYGQALTALCKYLAGDPTAACSPLHPIILRTEPIDFGPEIARYSENYSDRRWIEDKISDWIQFSSTRGFVIIGNPGSGKSALSASLSRSLQEQVIGIHFCSSVNPRSLLPMDFVANLVAQLFTQIPEYADIIKKMEPYTLFDNATRALRELVIEPLTSIKSPDLTPKNPKIIIVDSFDEAIQQGKESIFRLLLQQIDYFPPWLRIIATTRPEKEIIGMLGSKFTPLFLSENTVQNDQDIERYIDSILEKESYIKKFKDVDISVFKKALIKQSAGIFLYIVYVMKAILDGDIDPRKPERFPEDLAKFYVETFHEKFPKDSDYAPVRQILGVIIAAKEPLTSEELGAFLVKDKSEVESILRPLSSFFIRNNNMQFRLFHNSLKEWLSGVANNEKKNEETKYLVNLTEGRRIITDHCWKEFENGVKTMSKYAVTYLPFHLMEIGRYKELVTLFQNPKFFIRSWENDEFTVKKVWTDVEKNSDFRMIDAYKEIIETPSRYPDDFVMAFSEFLTDTGHPNESILLLEYVLKLYFRQLNEDKIEYCLSSLAWALYLVRSYERSYELLRLHEFICKNRNDTYNLQIGIGYQANLTSAASRSIDLYNQQEHLCRELGEKGKYWAEISVGNKGDTLFRMNLTELAFRLYQEKEQICKEISNYQGLQWAYGYQADYFSVKGDSKRALELYSQQYEIAQSISYSRGMRLSLENQLKIHESDGDSADVARIENKLLSLDQSVIPSSITIPSSNGEIFEELERVCVDKEQEYSHAKDNRGISKILSYKAFLLEMKKDYDAALQVYQKQEEIGNLTVSSIVVNNARRNAWRVYCEKGDLQHAFKMPVKYPDTFSPLWAKYDLLNFLDFLITFSSDKGNFDMIGSLMEYQVNFAEIDHLKIPISSFSQHIKWAGDKKDLRRIVWLVSHKTEFDIVIQNLALKNHYNEQVKLVISTIKDIAVTYYYRGDFSKSFDVYDSLQGYYSITKDQVEAEKILGEMGLNKEALGEFEQALTYYSAQARICRDASYFEDLVWALCNQGDILRKLGRLDQALELYREQEKISIEHKLASWLNRAKENIGDIYKDYGQYLHALTLFEQIVPKSDLHSSLKLSGRTLENIADIMYRIGDLNKAGKTYLQAVEQLTESQDLFDQWRILTKCAVIYDTLNQQEDYTACITRKQELIPLIKTEQLFSYLLTNQDHIHTIRFDLDLIFEWHEKKQVLERISEDITLPVGILLPQQGAGHGYRLIQPEEFAMIQKIGDLCKEHRFEMGLQYYYGFAGINEIISQNSPSARSVFTSQQEQCKKIGYREGLQMALGRIADIFFQAGDVTHAKSFTEEQLVLAKDLNSPESELQSSQRLADILITSEDYDGARKRLEEIQKSAEDLGSYHQIALSFYKQGLINQLTGSSEEAQKYFKMQEETARKAGDRYLSTIAVVKQAEILDTMGKN